MNELILILFIPSNIILSLVIFFNNPRSWTNRLFASLIFILTAYLTINTELAIFPDHNTKLFLSRTIIALGALINLLVYLFLKTFPNDKVTLRKPILYSLLSITVVLFFAGFSNLIFSNITVENNVVVPVPGILMPVFLIHTLGLVLGGIVAIFLKYRKSQGRDKNRIRYIFFSFVILFSLIIILNFIVTVFLKFGNFVPFLPLYIFIFNVIVAYAIVKHRLLDIRLVVARTVSYTLVVGVLAAYYGILFSLLVTFFSHSSIDQRTIVISTALALVMAFCLQPVKKIFEKITDKVFFKNRQNPQVILKKLSQVTNSTIDVSKLSNLILNNIIQEFRLTHGAIIIFSQDSQRKVSFVFQHGYDRPLDLTDNDVQFLAETSEILVFNEIEEGPKKDLLRHFNTAVCIPLISHGEHVGLALLGEKSSGSIYNDEEISILEIFAPEAAIAIQNATSYEEIILFNTKLQKEVQKATEDMKSITEDVYKKNIELNKVSTQLAEANAKLKDLDHLKDEFVSLASHELRTPMTAIKSYLWMFLQYNSTKLDPKEHQYIERAYEATDRLITLVNDMLNVSRIESGRMNILFMPVDLPKLANEVTEELTPTAQKQDVSFKVEAEDNLPSVTGDQNKIREVITNLVGNALKFSSPGGTITLKMHHDQDTVVTQVIDTGKGIKKEDLAKLFQKFGIVGNNYLQKTNSQGTGLGLYISKSIVELHGGKISVASEGENKGTTFSFTLKINQDTKQANTESAPVIHQDTTSAIVAA